MGWIQGTNDGNAQNTLELLVAFLTNHSSLVADGDAWTVLAQTSQAIRHPTNSNYCISKGYYLRGAGLSNAPILFVASTDETTTANALIFSALLAFDASLTDSWWLQAGSGYDYAPVTVPKTGGSFEFMANGRRITGYFSDDQGRCAPFYAGWFIPYTDSQNQNYVHPSACLGSDRYLDFCVMGYSDNQYGVGLCHAVSASTNTIQKADRANKGSFLLMPDGSCEQIQATSLNDGVVSAYSSAKVNSYHLKHKSYLTLNGKSRLYPEIMRYGSSNVLVLGELDGIAGIGQVGAQQGSVISDDNDTEWVVIFQRTTPSRGCDGYAIRRV